MPFQEKANIEYAKISETQKFDQAIAEYKAQINSFQAEKKRLSMTLDEKKEQERHEHDKACESSLVFIYQTNRLKALLSCSNLLYEELTRKYHTVISSDSPSTVG